MFKLTLFITTTGMYRYNWLSTFKIPQLWLILITYITNVTIAVNNKVKTTVRDRTVLLKSPFHYKVSKQLLAVSNKQTSMELQITLKDTEKVLFIKNKLPMDMFFCEIDKSTFLFRSKL